MAVEKARGNSDGVAGIVRAKVNDKGNVKIVDQAGSDFSTQITAASVCTGAHVGRNDIILLTLQPYADLLPVPELACFKRN